MSQTPNTGWRDVQRPRKWFPGMRVRGLRNPSGQEYRIAHGVIPRSQRKTYDGVLIRNEWMPAAIIYPRYTVACDDGTVRRFQVIEAL